MRRRSRCYNPAKRKGNVPMGKMESAPLSRPPREPREFPWTKALLAAVVVLLGWIGYQQATKPEKPSPPPGWLLNRKAPPPQVIYVVEKPSTAALRPVDPPPADPAPPATADAAVIHESVQDFAAKADRPTEPAPAPQPAKKPETDSQVAERCLQFSAEIDTTQPVERPFSVLVNMHAKNNCAASFPGEHVWATVFIVGTGGDGSGAIGSDFGHFAGTISPFGQADAMMEIQCDPNQARSALAKFRFFRM